MNHIPLSIERSALIFRLGQARTYKTENIAVLKERIYEVERKIREGDQP